MARQAGMVRETFKHAAIYSGATMIGRMMGFIMLPFYAHVLQAIGYGVIGMIDTGLVMLGSLLAYNFQGAVVRIYHEQAELKDKRSVVSSGTLLVAMIVLPLAGLGMAFSAPISQGLLGSSEYWPLVCMALGTFFLDMTGQTARSLLVIERRSATYSSLSLLRLMLGLSLNIVLIVILQWGLTGYFLSALITSSISETIAVAIMARSCGWRWHRTLGKALLDYQLPLIPGALARFASRQVERIVVRYQLDLSALGVLEMAYKFPVLINMLLLQPFLQSWGTKSIEIADQEGGPRRIADMFSYFLFVGAFGFVLMSVNIRTVLELLTPPAFWPAAQVAVVQSAHIVLMGVANYAAFGLFYAKRTDLMARITIVTSIAKVGLSYLMISIWGLHGAAWSGLVTTSVMVIWRSVLGQRFYRLEPEWGKIMLIVVAAGGLVAGIGQVSTESIATWGAPAVDLMGRMATSLEGTALGDWKNGKLIELFLERSPLVLDLAVRTLMALSFLLLMPLVHIETQKKIALRVGAWGLPKRQD